MKVLKIGLPRCKYENISYYKRLWLLTLGVLLNFKIFFLTEYPILGTYLHLPRYSSIDACPIRNFTSFKVMVKSGKRGHERATVQSQADEMHMAGRFTSTIPVVRLPYSNNIFYYSCFLQRDMAFIHHSCRHCKRVQMVT